jgi:hypothetical protein
VLNVPEALPMNCGAREVIAELSAAGLAIAIPVPEMTSGAISCQ